mmetsp:Transcript_19244/g.59796  ORF Transcript_19244/g.59796 Transcript_19244/m.59796 type:complete len:263 (-) Transcript_19244:3317-4105(-)
MFSLLSCAWPSAAASAASASSCSLRASFIARFASIVSVNTGCGAAVGRAPAAEPTRAGAGGAASVLAFGGLLGDAGAVDLGVTMVACRVAGSLSSGSSSRPLVEILTEPSSVGDADSWLMVERRSSAASTRLRSMSVRGASTSVSVGCGIIALLLFASWCKSACDPVWRNDFMRNDLAVNVELSKPPPDMVCVPLKFLSSSSIASRYAICPTAKGAMSRIGGCSSAFCFASSASIFSWSLSTMMATERLIKMKFPIMYSDTK